MSYYTSDSNASAAHIPASPECAEEYLADYRLPMLVYVQDEEKTKHYATIKKNFMIRGWPAAKDETLPEFVARVLLRDEPLSLKDALQELMIAEGDWADNTLWYMWRKLPGYMDTAGVAYLPEQDACREYFRDMALPSSLPCIVSGFPEDQVVFEKSCLFRVGVRDDLTPQDAVYYVTARSISFEEALLVLLVQCPGKIGHGLSLREIMDTYSVEQQAIVGRLTSDEVDEVRKLRVIGEVQVYLKQIEQEPTKQGRADVTTSLMEYLLTDEAAWFVRKYDKFRQVVLEKCEEIMREERAAFPALEAACVEVMRIYGDFRFPFSGAPPRPGDETSGAPPRKSEDETSGARPLGVAPVAAATKAE